ncbi:MAG TPA: hypothetical protein VIC32_06555 [Terriglobales bacterium]|jgi:uncharacterized BrkB/YihY/UPF0761 family membrane protein
MHGAYITILVLCTVGVIALIVRRPPGKLNDWTWTAIPVAVLVALLWLAFQ